MSWHRRKLAALATVSAVLTGIAAATPEPEPTIPVLVAAGGVAAGRTFTHDDLTVQDVAASVAPAGVQSELPAVVGQVAAGAVADGQMITDVDLLGPRSPTRSGQVTLPVRIADREVVALLEVGDRVDLLAAVPDAATARMVARQVLIVGLPPPSDGVGGSGSAEGSLVLVETEEKTAGVLAQATVSAQLTVVWR